VTGSDRCITSENSRVWRSLAAGVVLAIPVALTLGSTVRKDADAIRAHSRLDAVEATVVPPYDYGASENVPLLLGIRRHVPRDAQLSFVPRGGPAEQRLFIATGWIRWVGFVVAPRLVDAGVGSPWLVLVGHTPQSAGIRPRHVWRYGRDWLVER
jgi:hypothetical protein